MHYIVLSTDSIFMFTNLFTWLKMLALLRESIIIQKSVIRIKFIRICYITYVQHIAIIVTLSTHTHPHTHTLTPTHTHSSEHYRTIKLFFIGSGERGKTTLLRRLQGVGMYQYYLSTLYYYTAYMYKRASLQSTCMYIYM